MYVSIFVFFLALNYPSLKKLEENIVEGIFTHNYRFLQTTSSMHQPKWLSLNYKDVEVVNFADSALNGVSPI